MESLSPLRRKAFTLLEVLLSVAIFLLLAGGIFAAVMTTSRTATEIALTRLQSERRDALHRFLRHLYANLPPTASLELRMNTRNRASGTAELLISPAPGFADFRDTSRRSGGLALSLIEDKAGHPTFSAANFDSTLSGSPRDQDMQASLWIPLLPDVVQLRWRFIGKELPGLQETWTPENGRPTLADLELTLSDGSVEQWQFAIPPVQKPVSPRTSPAS